MGWYNSSWTYRVRLEVPSTQVTGTHTNFPIPIDLSDSKFDNLKSLLSSNALSNGDDILFTDDDGTTKLDHEIQSYNNTTGNLIAWVKIPSGITDSSNKEFFIYFGNSGASNQENSTGVWSNNFSFVSHDGGITDSTSNSNSTTNNGTTSITGKIGDGRNFDGTDDYISITDDTSIQFSSNFSISLLFKSDELIDSSRVSTEAIALFNRENDWLLRWFSGDGGSLRFGTFGGNITSTKSTWSADTWFHVAVSIANPTSSIRMLVDGSVDSTGSGDSITITDPKNIIMGSTQDGLDSFFDGIFDEVRIHSTNRSDNWFTTESSALKDATNFINVLEVTTNEATNITTSDADLNAYQNIDNTIERGFLYDTVSRDKPVGTTDTILDTESFETNFGDWVSSTGTNQEWLRNSGGTPSSNTGADSAHDGSWYIYVETSGANTSDVATLTYDIGSTKDGYVDFWYYMYGNTDIGTLVLEGWNGSWNQIWSISGNQGQQWVNVTTGNTDFTGYSQIRFRYHSYSDFNGDVCLDLIEVHETTTGTLPDGDYSNKVNETIEHSNATPPSYYDNNWTEVDEISVQSSQVTGTHTDYKLLIDLSDSKFQILKDNLKANAQSNGNDILFTDDDGTTKLDHEIENYDDTTGNLIAWVKIPSGVNSTTDKSIYMYYGNSGATNQQNATGVWGNNTYGIYHLNNSFNDSSSNGNNATNNGTTDSEGKISRGRQYGSSNYINLGNLFEDPPFTLSAWIYSTGFTSGSFNINTIYSKESGSVQSFGLRIGDSGIADNRLQFAVRQSDGTEFKINGTLLNSSEWYHVVATYDTDGSMNLYLNGSSDGTDTADGTTQSTTGVDILSGMMDTVREFNGNQDELRLLSEVIDSDTVATEYSNQNSPETFISWVNEPSKFSSGTYSEQLTSLTEGERYYFRAYSYDGTDYYFGEELNFSTVVNPNDTSHKISPDLAGYIISGTIEYISSSLVEEVPFTTSSSWTHSHTLPTGGGNYRKLLVNVHVNEAGDDLVEVTAISYGGINILSNLLEENQGTGAFYPNTTTFEILESDLATLTPGNSYDLDVTLSLGRDGATSIVLVKDTEQVTSESSQGTNFSSSASTDLTTSNSSDYILFDFITGAFDTLFSSADVSQTVIYNEDNSGNHSRPYGASYKAVSGASTYSMAWTLNANGRWMQNVIGVEELQETTILIVPIYESTHNTTTTSSTVTSSVDSCSHSHSADNSLTENPVNDSSHVHTSENAPISSSPSDSEHIHTSENSTVTSSSNESEHIHTSENSTVTSSVEETEHTHSSDNSTVTSSVNESEHVHTVENSTVISGANETEHSLSSDNSTVTSSVNDSTHVNNTETSISLSVAEDTSHSHVLESSTVTSSSSDTQHTLTSENAPVTSVIEDSAHIQTVEDVNVTILPNESNHIHTADNSGATSSVEESSHSHTSENSIVTSTVNNGSHIQTSDNSTVTSSVNETEHNHTSENINVTVSPEESTHTHTSDNSTVTSLVNDSEHNHTADVSISEQFADRATHVHTAENSTVTSVVEDSLHNHESEQARDITRIDNSEHQHTSENSFVTSSVNQSEHVHTSENTKIVTNIQDSEHVHTSESPKVTSSVEESEHMLSSETAEIVTNIQDSEHTHSVDNSTVTSNVDESEHVHSSENSFTISSVNDNEHIHTVENSEVIISPENSEHIHTSENSTVTSLVNDSEHSHTADVSISEQFADRATHVHTAENSTVTSVAENSLHDHESEQARDITRINDSEHVHTSENSTVTSLVDDSTHINNTDSVFVGTSVDETTHINTTENSTVTSNVDESEHVHSSDNSTVTSSVEDSEHTNVTESSTPLISVSNGTHVHTVDESTLLISPEETEHLHTSENSTVTSLVNDSTSSTEVENSFVTSVSENSSHVHTVENSSPLSTASETVHTLTSDISLTELPVDNSSHTLSSENAFVTSSVESTGHTHTSEEAIDLVSTEDTSHQHTTDDVTVTSLVHDTLHGHMGGYQTEEEVISERFIRMLEIEYDVSDERSSLISSINRQNDERLSTWERYPPLTTHTMYLGLEKVREWDTEIRIRQTVIELGDVVINIEPPTVVDHDVITNMFLEFDGGDIDHFRKGDTDTDVLLFTKRPTENRVDLQVAHKYMHYQTDYSTDVQGTAFAKGEEAKPLHPYSLENIILVNQFILIKLNPSATLFTNDNTEYIMVKKKNVEELKTEVENENASLLDDMIILTPNKSKYVFNDIYEDLIDESYTINMWTPEEIPSDHKTVLDGIRREEKYKSKWILLYRDVSDNPLVEVIK